MRSIVFSTLISAVWCWDDVILAPPSSKQGPVGVIYFAQGADLKTDQYTKIMSTLQETVDFPLWVGIPQCPMDVAAIPGALESGIQRVNEAMVGQGMDAQFDFYAGHSLGGAMMPDYVNDHAADTADGQILMGAFLTRKFKTGSTAEGRPQVEYPVSTLTIGGELDGLCRLTRISEALYTQVTFAADPESARDLMPVTVIPGMNHMEFASGEIPSFVLDHDLRAEISEDQAQKEATYDMAAFLNSKVYPDNSVYISALRTRVQESVEFTQPIIDAFLMESYEQFLPPCYCEAQDEYGGLQYGTCESTPACTGGVAWTSQYSQVLMGGLDEPEVKGLSISSADSIHLVTEEDPSCHLPHIHGNPVDNANPGNGDTPPICSSPEGCTLDLTTVTQHLYHNSGEVDIWRLHFDVDWLDTGYLPLAAAELKTKLKSRQAVWEAAGVQNVSYAQTDLIVTDGGDGDRCGAINQAAIDWALGKLPEKTRTRFEEYGQKLLVGADLSTCAAGPCWIWDNLKFDRDNEANTVNIQAVYMGTENYNKYPCGESKKIPCSAGFHYCKLLSPARALEWMYVDGLRNKLATNKV
jgi:hypothetical protein